MSAWRRAVLVVLVLALLGPGPLGEPAGAAPAPAVRGQEVGPRTYRPPTSAPVADPFRPPPAPWLPGNRGIEYATERGDPVGAIGAGTVAFAGQVGGRLVVVVQHPDGLRSSYVGLAAISVRVRTTVGGGDVLGLAAGPLHLGVRRGDEYLDPASLWGTAVAGGRTVLVPVGPDPAPGRRNGRRDRPGGRRSLAPANRWGGAPRWWR